MTHRGIIVAFQVRAAHAESFDHSPAYCTLSVHVNTLPVLPRSRFPWVTFSTLQFAHVGVRGVYGVAAHACSGCLQMQLQD